MSRPNGERQIGLLTVQVERGNATDETRNQQTLVPLRPRSFNGVGVNSDSGGTGEVVLEDSEKAITVGNIAEIRVEGNKLVPTDEILAMIKSKPGEPVDEKQMRADVRAIYSSRRFFSVTPHLVRTDKGVNLLFQVVERPLIERVEFRGADQITAEELEKLTGLRRKSLRCFEQSRGRSTDRGALPTEGIFVCEVNLIEEYSGTIAKLSSRLSPNPNWNSTIRVAWNGDMVIGHCMSRPIRVSDWLRRGNRQFSSFGRRRLGRNHEERENFDWTFDGLQRLQLDSHDGGRVPTSGR